MQVSIYNSSSPFRFGPLGDEAIASNELVKGSDDIKIYPRFAPDHGLPDLSSWMSTEA